MIGKTQQAAQAPAEWATQVGQVNRSSLFPPLLDVRCRREPGLDFAVLHL
jgi:hypothetical protein